MRAAVLNNYGNATEVFNCVDEFEKPEPQRGEVLVRLKATSVNPIECRMRNGYGRRVFTKKRGFEFPLILGNDLSGTVERVGADVTNFQTGDAVFAAPDVKGQGSYAEYRAVSADLCIKKPENLTFIEAASIPYVACTVWQALVEKGGLSEATASGKKVLVHGGSGGIGSFAIQLLKAWGAYVATTCSASKISWVEQLGPDLVIDYVNEDFTATLSDFDLVLDTVGGDNESKSLKILARQNRQDASPCYVTLITPLLRNVDEQGFLKGGITSLVTLLRKKRAFKKQGVRYEWVLFKSNHEALKATKILLEKGLIHPVIDRTYPLSEIAAAHQYVESGKARGKVVIEI